MCLFVPDGISVVVTAAKRLIGGERSRVTESSGGRRLVVVVGRVFDRSESE